MRSFPLTAMFGLVVFASACTPLQRAPGAVRPTLDALTILGLRCGGGEADQVPSGLYQWQCSDPGAARGRAVLVNGNDAGVASLDIVSPTDDPAAARAWVQQVVAATPPLSTLEGLGAGVDTEFEAWTGTQLLVDLGQLGVAAGCSPPSQFGEGQCVFTISGADPNKPMLQ